MEATATKIRSESRSVEIIYSGISAWIIMIFYVVVGTLVFAFPATTEAQAKMITGSLLVVFFLRGHLEGLLGGLQTFTTSNVAMRNLESLGLSQPETVKSGSNRVAVHDLPSWRRLEIVGAAHSYPAEEGSGRFVLGPLHLAFTPGQVVFVSGGNGSGKTTLAKLLTGLYVPESGQIVLDGEPIDDRTREQYRQHFSAVFFDFFVFDEIVSANPAAADASACEYLSQLRLSHKVTVTNGVLSTTKLSQGQRKRLALLMAYLEDRPIYVFDEWAADQDPQFKDVFYLELLPRLRARDKTVFVISHDDRYYHVADRVIKLDYGQVEQDFVPISAETSVHAGGDTN
jgi:putative ATP-binding cassette transporter